MTNVFATSIVDFTASIIGSPPAYTISAQPPKLNNRNPPPPSSQLSNVLPSILVTQHTNSYSLQLYLRLAKLPHNVVNTPYHRCNDGAAYPTLTTISPNLNIVVPSPLPGGGGALSYVKESLPVDEDAPSALPLPPPLLHLTSVKSLHDDASSPHNFNEELVLTNLIQTNLAPLLLGLEFADEDVGYEVTRSRWATQLPPLLGVFSAIRIFCHISDNLKIWAEKVSVLRSLGVGGVVPVRRRESSGFFDAGSSLHLDVGETIRRSVAIYEAINEKIVESGGVEGGYLFGDSPSPVDCLLFGHVAQALANPHLAKIFGNFPALLKWFVGMVRRSKLNEETTANDQVNRMNQHYTLPATFEFALKLLEGARGSGEVEIADVNSVIAAAHAKDMAVQRSLINLHRLRFGGAMAADGKVASVSEGAPLHQSEAMRQVKEANKVDNQMWIGGVGVLSIGFLLYGAHGVSLTT